MPLRQSVIKNVRRLALLATVFLFCEACYHPLNSFDCPNANSDDSLSIDFISIHKLNVKLEEVSGISMDSRGLLWCINDEEGVLYQLDTSHKVITTQLPFGPPGDYEGVAIRNDTAFTIRSDAIIFEFAMDDPNSLSVKKIQQLPAKCETESIATNNYDLFTICKTQKNQGRNIIYKLIDSGSSYTAVEAFDLTDCLTDFLTQEGISKKYRPTDLYYDHWNKRWLMSATKPSTLVIFDEKGNWVLGAMLDAKDWPQPEGISQLNDSMYILTSESKGFGILGQFKVQ
jgi:hypothetical protein